MARHPKLRRKDLKKPDEFVTFTRKLVDFAREHATVAIGAALVVAALLLGAGGFSLWTQMERGAANVAFASARTLFVSEEYKPAQEAFQSVAERYSGTIYGATALLYAADSALASGDYETAGTLYRRFLAGDSAPEYLRQAALVRLGLAEERAGRIGEARRTYEEAHGLVGPFAADALLGQARTARLSGDAAAARRLYEQFLDAHPSSPMLVTVRSELAALQPPETGAKAQEEPPRN